MPDHGGPVEVTLVIVARPGTIFRYFTDPARRAQLLGRCLVDGAGSATRPPPSTAPGGWPSTSAWSSG
jgi:uncharacterized protein YndB with AHSA1/START domain